MRFISEGGRGGLSEQEWQDVIRPIGQTMSGPHDNDRCSGCGAVGEERHEDYCRFGRPPLQVWLLERIHDRFASEWDVTNAVVVQAASEADARKLASTKHGLEGRDAWLDSTMVRCQKLPLEEGVARVLAYEHAT